MTLTRYFLNPVIDFHHKYYVPENITIVVTGQQISPERLLRTINDTTERDIVKAGLARGPRPQDWIRPFVQSSTARLDPIIMEDRTIDVSWPDADGTEGEINILWIGPKLKDSLTLAALSVLGEYLCGSAHSVLLKKFGHSSNALCEGTNLSRFQPCFVSR
jgi:Zn-dependent M16 (insulinase) family peptidase